MSLARCPNKSHKDYKLLVRLFDENRALDIYDRNGKEIPTRQEILDGFRRSHFNKVYKTGKITQDYRYYINRIGEQEELTPEHNPVTWAIENREDLIERFRTDEKTGKRTKIYKAFSPNKAVLLAKELKEVYPFATFTPYRFDTTDKANYRVRVSTPYSIPEYEQRLDINYTFSVVNALNDIKNDRKTIRLPSKDKPNIEINLRKLLGSKGVSKQQVDMLFDYMRDKGINEIPIEDLIISMEADLAYTVEIETTLKDRRVGESTSAAGFPNEEIITVEEFPDNTMLLTFADNQTRIVSKGEFKKIELVPTQYHINLTVPGGTNYTEQEIRTPQIIPSIKGHAQFTTDQGIGWFRSDEYIIEKSEEKIDKLPYGTITVDKNRYEWITSQNIYKKNGKDINRDEFLKAYEKYTGEKISEIKTKTRRILEIQSDLFQKGRNRKILVAARRIVGESFTSSENNVTYEIRESDNRLFVYDTSKKQYIINKNEVPDDVKEWVLRLPAGKAKNEFLQLLNKQNNWIKFFIQSIIQDSAKRGYEKVLFPTGETAAKVEGHETIANELQNINSRLNIIEKEITYNKENLETTEPSVLTEYQNLKERKQELKTQGIEKLKPIENFYENTIKNNLKKLGYKTERISDEHGNEWYEYTIQNKDLTSSIELQRQQDRPKLSKPEYEELRGRLLKKFPHVTEVIEDNSLSVLGTLEAGGTIIRINMKEMVDSTIGHEFGHLLVDLIGGLDNSLVKAGLKQLRGTELERQIQNAYPELVETNSPKLDKELIAEAIGRELPSVLKEFQSEEAKTKFQRWLIRFFRRLKQVLGIDKDAVRQLTREMLSDKKLKVRGEVADNYESRPLTGYKEIDEVQEIKTDEERIVDKAIDNLHKKLNIYKNSQNKGFVERLSKELEELEFAQSPVEAMINFIDLAGKEITFVYNRYKKAEEEFNNGNTSVFDLKTLKTWNEYVSAFNILEDIQKVIVKRIGYDKLKEDHKVTKQYMDDIITLRNTIQEGTVQYAMESMVNVMRPNFTRIENSFKEQAERIYLKQTKSFRKENTLEDYINKYLDLREEEIDQISRNYLLNELQEAQFDITWAERWLDNITSSDDGVVSTMVKTISQQMMDSKLKKVEYANKMWEAQKELERVIPNHLFKSPKKAYDFMWEKDSKGKYTGAFISKYKSKLMNDYRDFKESINSNDKLSPTQKSAKLREWKKKNVPLDFKSFNKGKYEYIKKLFDEGLITSDEVNAIQINDNIRNSLPIEDVLKDNPLAAEEIKTWIYENVWNYRTPVDKWLNPQFDELVKLREKNPEDPRIKFYDLVIDSLEESDSMVPQKDRLSYFGLSYNAPRVQKDIAERFLDKDGIPTILKEETKQTLGRTRHDVDRGQVGEEGEKEVFLDELNRLKRFIPVYFTGEFDPKNQSYDVATIVTKRYQMALDYAYKQEILPTVEWSQYFLENREVVVTDTKGNPLKNANKFLRKRELTKSGLNSFISSQYSDWLKMYFFGETRAEGLDFNVLGLSVNSEKALDLLNKNTAYAMLGFNMVQGIANVNLAEITQRIEAFAGEFYNMKDYQKAALKYDVYIPRILADIGNRRPTNLIDLIAERFDYLDDYKITPKFRKKGVFRRSLNTSNAFFLSHAGEHMMQNKAALAMLNYIKLTDNNGNNVYKTKGGEMTLLDALYVDKETNTLRILDKGKDKDGNDVEIKQFTDKELNVIGFKIQEHLAKMHGDYRDKTRAAWQYYALGRMAGMFRKFIVPGFRRRWAKSKKLSDGSRRFKYNEYGEFSYEGYYRTFGRFFGGLLKELWDMKANIVAKKANKVKRSDDSRYSNLTNMERANIKRASAEFITLISMIVLGNIFLKQKDEADDEWTDWYTSMLAYQTLRLRSELFFFLNPLETFRILRSPAASMSIVENLIKLIELIINPFDDEKLTDKFERGPWKDRWKGSKYLTNSLGQLAAIKQTKRLLDMEGQLNWFKD